MEIQNYNLDDPIPTSCAPWGSLEFPKHAPVPKNITASEIDERRAKIRETTINPPILSPYLEKEIESYRSLGHTEDQAQKKKENNMCYSKNTSTGAVASISVAPDRSDADKRDHLKAQLREARYEKMSEAAPLFNLNVNNTPKTFRDLIAAIKDGKFTIDEKFAKKVDAKIANDEPIWYSPLEGIIWDGPQQDYAGYHAFEDHLQKEYQKAKDEIIVLPLEQGLEALRRFQALEVAAIKA